MAITGAEYRKAAWPTGDDVVQLGRRGRGELVTSEHGGVHTQTEFPPL
jgi:hypothetical protein